jgi:hypothetical protein
MKALVLTLTILLAGCASQPVPVKFRLPQMPEILSKECPPLQTIEGDSTTLSQLMAVVAANYSLYHECATQQKSTVEWFQIQRETLEAGQR